MKSNTARPWGWTPLRTDRDRCEPSLEESRTEPYGSRLLDPDPGSCGRPAGTPLQNECLTAEPQNDSQHPRGIVNRRAWHDRGGRDLGHPVTGTSACCRAPIARFSLLLQQVSEDSEFHPSSHSRSRYRKDHGRRSLIHCSSIGRRTPTSRFVGFRLVPRRRIAKRGNSPC